MNSEREHVLMLIWRREWSRPGFVEALARRYELRVVEQAIMARERRRKTARVASKLEMAITELLLLGRLLLSPSLYSGRWLFVCFSGHFAALTMGRLLGWVGIQRRIYLFNFYLHALGENALVKRLLRFLLTENVRIIAQARADDLYFQQFVPREHIVRIPYCKPDPPEFVPLAEAKRGEYVFSGGWTNRDYDALLRCAAALPDIPFVVVASQHSTITEPTPPNVVLKFDQPPEDFERMLAESRFVVIPLEHDVGSSGQMVLLTAMQFAKTVLIPGLGAVDDYIDHDRTAVTYRHEDPEALCAAIAELYVDDPRLESIGRAARTEFLERFTIENFNRPALEYLANS